MNYYLQLYKIMCILSCLFTDDDVCVCFLENKINEQSKMIQLLNTYPHMNEFNNCKIM